MANQLIIRFHQIRAGMDPDMVSWVNVSEDGQYSEIFQGSLDEIANQASGKKITVIVPGSDALLTTASVPTTNRKRLMTALPYALEDHLVTDVEDLHFAIGDRNAAGDIACAIVAREKMDGWVSQLKQFGMQADQIVPDVLALPNDDMSWTLLADEHDVLIRTAKQAGFTTEAENAEQLLRLLIDENSEHLPQRLFIFKVDDGSTTLSDLSNLGLEVKEDFSSNSLLPLVTGLNQHNSINLLQGDYSRREQMGKVWRPWLPAAAMLAGLIFLQLAMTTTDYFQLKIRNDELKAQIKQTYLAAFPGAKNIVKPRVQMERKLKALRSGAGQGGNSALGLLSGSAPVFKATQGLIIRSVRYKEGKMDVDLIVDNLQTLDKLKQQLIKQADVSVDIVSANSRNDKVESRLKIQGTES